MAFSISKKEIIKYPPEALRGFHLSTYEWIDNLHFMLKPEECLDEPAPYVAIVKELFLAEHWDGDGEVQLLWVPPFMLAESPAFDQTHGVVIWHVKQTEDGISWLLSPIQLPFD